MTVRVGVLGTGMIGTGHVHRLAGNVVGASAARPRAWATAPEAGSTSSPSTWVVGRWPLPSRSSNRLLNPSGRRTFGWITRVPIPRRRTRTPLSTRYCMARRMVGRDSPSCPASCTSLSNRVPGRSRPSRIAASSTWATWK